LGRSISIELAHHGFDIVFTDLVDDNETAKARKMIKESGREVRKKAN
jgi:hypothetical protein